MGIWDGVEIKDKMEIDYSVPDSGRIRIGMSSVHCVE